MRDKVLGVFLDRALLVEDRAVGYLLQQSDPVAASLRVVESVGRLADPPLVVGLSEVLQHLEAQPHTSSVVVLMPEPGSGGGVPPPRLPDTLPGARALPREVVPAPAIAPPPAPAHIAALEPAARPLPATPRGATVDRACGLEVLRDITGNSTCSGQASDFTHYFQDRFNKLRRLIANRQEMSGALPIAALQHKTGAVKTLGIVQTRSSTSKGGVIFELEDTTGSVKVLCMQDRAPIDIVTDEVVGVMGKLNADRTLIYADTIVRPEIPVRRNGHRTERDLHVAFASDIHVGSSTFLDAHWDRFMDFLNGRLETSNGLLDTLEYLIVPGDLVDGIGVYPNQREELLIPDMWRQYEALAELLKDVPDRIEVVLLPGNHDAVRQAEPQPALPRDIQKLFAGKVRFLGNPVMLGIEGVHVLAYHGHSIDDFVQTVQGCTYEQPLVTMKEMLKRRHLAPVYGGKVPIAPEASDHLVIDTIPDIFVTGHVHGAGVEAHRGTLLINSSAWQSQTRYQKSMNFVPDPAKVPIVNLRDMSVKIMDFAA
jgi:DNA polymerase II small subunit